MKKLALSFLILPLLVPAQSVQALSTYFNPEEQIWENVQNADSIDIAVGINGAFAYAGESPYRFSVNGNVETTTDVTTPVVGEYAAAWSFTDVSHNETVSGNGSAIVDSDKLYFREGSEEWQFLPIEQTMYDNADVEAMQAEMAHMDVFEMVKQSIVVTGELPRERVNGVMNYHYGYRIDTDKLLTAATNEQMYDAAEIEELKWYLNTFVTLEGEIWINPRTLYPSRLTFNASLNDAEVGNGEVNVTIEFRSFNQPVDVEIPANAIDARTGQNVPVVERDSDGDGLLDSEEHRWGSNPYSTDTDGDGYDDYTEVTNGYDPNGYGPLDTDGDGLRDYHEIHRHFTNPYHPDSDGDGYPDGLEITHGYNPNGPGRL